MAFTGMVDGWWIGGQWDGWMVRGRALTHTTLHFPPKSATKFLNTMMSSQTTEREDKPAAAAPAVDDEPDDW